MNVLLMQPYFQNEPRSPIAILDLAAYGRQFGHVVEVEYLSAHANYDGFDVVGISAIAFNNEVREQLRHIREHYKGRIVLGGKCCDTLATEEIVQLQAIGIEVFTSPGEYLFAREEIDYQHYPAWNASDFARLDPNNSHNEVMTTRGCPYRCNFCHNTEPRIRHFAPSRTVDICEMLLSKYRKQSLFFVDDVFALDVSHMAAILDEADRRGVVLSGKTTFFSHISQLDEERIEAISRYDPMHVQLGIESGNADMLRAMGKTFSPEEASRKLRMLWERGIPVVCLFLLGFPGETKESLNDTVDFIRQHVQYTLACCAGYYQPVRGTVGWGLAEARVGEIEPKGWNREISYVDPNITGDDLEAAHKAIEELN